VIKAVLHVHSTWSDGEFTLPELREKFLAAGCSLVMMTDHADAFDASSVEGYVRGCAAVSDARLTFIPGLEFGCVQRIHIVGYGVTALLDSDDPLTAIRHIHAHGGVAMIAHPPTALFGFLEAPAREADGIEVWNSKYDGRYAPRPETFDFTRRLRRSDGRPHGFFGQDLHWRKQYSGLFNQIDAPTTERSVVLDALRHGRFAGVNEEFTLASNAELPPELRERFAKASARSLRVRAMIKRLRQAMGPAFKLLPAPIKAQVRRIF
jgi:hypothetical protein